MISNWITFTKFRERFYEGVYILRGHPDDDMQCKQVKPPRLNKNCPPDKKYKWSGANHICLLCMYVCGSSQTDGRE